MTDTIAMPLKITDTVLRDGHQSLLATRMRTDDMLPIAAELDEVGYFSLEVWGGATFDTCLRFLNEDPWERLRQLKAHIKKTPLQMLMRGQNVVGYRNYADDVVERFVVKARENGIDIFRIFDALNDIRNLEKAMSVVKREGGHVQGTFSYTISPVHTIDTFVVMSRQMADLGADSICIKDMAGLLTPYAAYELVGKLKASVAVPIQLHSHYTSGMASAAVIKAAEAGVDIVDTAISTMSLATSQPPTESIVAMFKGTPRDTGLDLEKLSKIAAYFGEIRKKYHAFESNFVGVDTNVLTFQIPGGMYSNLASQLREQNALDKLAEVLAEVPRVRAEMGYPPLVTPSSQFVGTQATLNVVAGERYKIIISEIKNYVKGLYGTPPGPLDPQVVKLAIGDEEIVKCRPADLLKPEMEKAAAEIGSLAQSEEDILSYALFPQVARDFFKKREAGEVHENEIIAAIAAVLAAPADSVQTTVTTVGENGGRSPWRAAGRYMLARPSSWRHG
ncbi:MAG: oxaloacetate decarboxylase subunit alpha [Dehalococcoidia bacterium]|nr:oxaloacetate decarboxylase subunit alpha [Dehalococcoidia bacterium]